tara:strand:+ start:235 stop:471 length:237 start_codon:yes stop_codon:yes gene_type:complete
MKTNQINIGTKTMETLKKKEKKEVLVYTGTGEVKTLKQERQINFNTLCRNIEEIDNLKDNKQRLFEKKDIDNELFLNN